MRRPEVGTSWAFYSNPIKASAAVTSIMRQGMRLERQESFSQGLVGHGREVARVWNTVLREPLQSSKAQNDLIRFIILERIYWLCRESFLERGGVR